MKTNLKKVYKFHNKDLEKRQISYILNYLGWSGSHMLFPFKDSWETKKGFKFQYGETRVDIKITHLKY